jgi:hypothetical protein
LQVISSKLGGKKYQSDHLVAYTNYQHIILIRMILQEKLKI